MLYKLFCKGIPLCCNIINIKMSHLIVKEIYILIYAVTFSFSAEHLPENEVLTYQNFVVLASQKFPGIWHRLFDQPLYLDFGGVFSFSVRVSYSRFKIHWCLALRFAVNTTLIVKILALTNSALFFVLIH